MLRVLGLVSGFFVSTNSVAQPQPQQDTPASQGLVAQTSCSFPDPVQNSEGRPYENYEGKTIASIRFLQVSVFDLDDPSENNKLYAFLNKIHVDTRAATVGPQLLFEVGDTLDIDNIAETERLLRALPYLGNAQIVVDEVCGDEVALLVKTRDVWTLEVNVSAGREGGESKHGFGLSEENIAGTGNAFSIGYDKTEDRSSINYSFHSPHLLNSRLTLDIGFTETSDGQQTYFSLQRPFYSLQTPWAAGISALDTTFREKIRYRDETINSYRHGSEYNEVFTGLTVFANDSETRRLSVGLSQDRSYYDTTDETTGDIPVNENLVYPWLEYQYIENEFAVYHNLNQMHRVEDVSVGANYLLRLGYAGGMYGNDYNAWLYSANFDDILGVGDHHLLQYSLMLSGREYESQSELSRAVWGGTLGYYNLLGEKNRYYVSFSYHQGSNLLSHDELTVGGVAGLRGYPVDYLRGDKRYLLTLEQRYISNLHILNLVRVGAVTFLDFGRAWGADYPDAPHLSNIGVGLRLSSSKAKVGNILHLDLAFPLADKQSVDSFQWSVKVTKSL